MHPHPTSRRFILILSCRLCLGLPSGFCSSGLLIKTLYTPLLSPYVLLAPAKLVILYVITRIMYDEVYRSLCSSLCGLHHSPVTSSHLGPNIFLSTLFSNTLILGSYLNVTDQLSNPDKTTGKIIVLYYLTECFEHRMCNNHHNTLHPPP